jgi:hypothetical protein
MRIHKVNFQFAIISILLHSVTSSTFHLRNGQELNRVGGGLEFISPLIKENGYVKNGVRNLINGADATCSDLTSKACHDCLNAPRTRYCKYTKAFNMYRCCVSGDVDGICGSSDPDVICTD